MTEPTPCFLCGGTELEPWCEAQDAEYFTTKERYRFYECRRCRLLKIHPVPAEKLAVIYPPNYYSFDAGAGEGLLDRVKSVLDRGRFRRLLGRLPGSDLKVLDVGGGSGWILDLVRSASPRVKVTQVVDLDPGAQAAAERRGHRYFCGPIESFETRERFDLVILLNLIEHVADPLQVLSQVRSLLTPNGAVLVKTPNYDAMDARLFRHRNWAGFHCPRHWVLFTSDSFGALASRAGMRIEQFSYTQGAPFWAASVLAWLHGLGLVRIDGARPACAHPLFNPLLALFAAVDLVRSPFARTSQMFVVLRRDAAFPA